MRKPLLFTAILLTTFTFLGHTAGTFMVPGPEETALAQAYDLMKQTPVKMPIGPDQNLMSLQRGSDLCVSLYLLVSAVLLGLQLRREDKAVLRVTSSGLLGVAALSVVYFFPLPAIFCGVAGVCGIAASFK